MSSATAQRRVAQHRNHVQKSLVFHKRPRPIAHFTAPCWINDPCAPGYDPNTGLYHLFYQCNPHGCAWGNMSWGHIVSKDLLRWKRMPVQLTPDEIYDKEGVFTGCFAAPVKSKDLTLFYSSVQLLPFSWATPPYPRNAAGISVATSSDGGKTWKKSSKNPILLGEPEDINVSGYRDPFFSPWETLDEVRGTTGTLYGLVSGGIEGVGPTGFLYSVQQDDLTQWQYLDTLVELPIGYQSSKKWSGNFGVSWECINFMTLKSGDESRDFLILGVEGDLERNKVRNHNLSPNIPPKTVGAQLWMSGDLRKKGNSIKFVPQNDGILDHGSYYAANTFVDPLSGRRIVYGWIPEEDITPENAEEKGWNGSLAFPREIFLLTIRNVSTTLRTPLAEIPNFEVEEQSNGCQTIHTIGIRPIVESLRLRENALQTYTFTQQFLPQLGTRNKFLTTVSHTTWELEATISVTGACESVGFHIRHSRDLSIRTTIVFSPRDETIAVHRQASTPHSNLNKCTEQGAFSLFVLESSNSNVRKTIEKLYLRIRADGDVLEVFANDRFALTTMIYGDDLAISGGVTAFATGGDECVNFEQVSVWSGLNGMHSLFSQNFS